MLFKSSINIICSKSTKFPNIVRNLSIHEYQSLKLLRSKQINVPFGDVAFNVEEAKNICEKIVEKGGRDFVIKAQVLAGGRGKGKFDSGFESGVHVALEMSDALKITDSMIGHNLITKQTGKNGMPCSKVFICERIYSRKEFYVAITLDRSFVAPCLIGSSKGGVNIEEVAANDPSAIIKQKIDVFNGLSNEEARNFLSKLNFDKEHIEDASEQLVRLYQVFKEKDCTLLEINPFSETNDGKIYCMDCKLQFDANAMFRLKDADEYIDNSQIDPREVEATKHNLNYIGLDGNIGCLVNGAGLAMSTLDIITIHGGKPANFLDLGGGATAKQVTEALRLITNDSKVKTIFINIFGGIMRCDIIAEGIIEAAKTLKIKIPIVVRLQGTKKDEAKALLASSEVRIIPLDDLEESSKLVCNLAKIVEIAQQADLNVNFEMPI